MSKPNKNQQHEKNLETVDNTINGFPTSGSQQYEKTHECAVELWSRGMCMGEVMKKTNMTEDQIAKYREELDKNK
jgi:hypothetical protein